jgi:nucleoside-diphosphate-sugar epimerase
MKKVTVLGAAGRLGDQVAKAFLDGGWKVRAVARGARTRTLRAGVEPVEADASDREALVAACEGSDVIFNGLNPVYTDWQDKVMPMARNVLAAAKATGATHLFPGNVYNYGSEIPPLAGPDTPEHGSTRKGALRIEMERLFADAAGRDGVRTIVLRAGDFYGGAKRGSWFDLVVTAKIAKGTFTYPGPMDLPHAWAYLPDLARAFVSLAERRDSLAGFDRFTFPGHTMRGSDLKEFCEQAVGRPLRRAGMPWPIIRIGGVVYPMWREIAEMSYLWQRPHALSGDKLAAVIGPIEITPAAEAVRAALADLGTAIAPTRRAA